MSQDFDSLFKELTTSWLAHQDRHAAGEPIAVLAESRARLDTVRAAMLELLASQR